MSSNRLLYDQCNYVNDVAQSTGPLYYKTYLGANTNCGRYKCKDGNSIDREFIGKRVGMESELRNQTRYNSRCPSRKYNPCSLNNVKYPNMNNGFGCQPLRYKLGYGTCIEENPTINPYTCERNVTLRTNLRMPTYRGFNRKVLDANKYCSDI